MWCHIATVLGLCRPAEDSEFRESLSYIMKFCLKMTLNKQTKNNPNPQEPKTQSLKNCQLSKYIYHLLRTTKKKKKTDHMILLKAKIGSRGFVI